MDKVKAQGPGLPERLIWSYFLCCKLFAACPTKETYHIRLIRRIVIRACIGMAVRYTKYIRIDTSQSVLIDLF